jgi:anti-sigma B factor antagonist
MEMTERAVGNVTVLDMSGKVTLSDGSDRTLSDKLRSLVQQNRKQLLLNLGNVSYVDSAGLGAIVHSYATVKNQGGSLKLLNVTGKLRDLLSITKLLTVFDTYEDETEAIKSF